MGKKAKAIRNEKKAKAIVKEKKTKKEKASKKKPKVNPVSGKPCGSVAGPICHGYNLRCFKTSSLAKCKESCKKDKRCNLAEWKPSTKHCCDSAVATKKGCTAAGKKVGKNALWARAHGWTGYTICRGHAEEIIAKKVLKGRLSPKCEKKSKEKKAKEARAKREKRAKEAVSKEKAQKEKKRKGRQTKEKKEKESSAKIEKVRKEKTTKESKKKEVRAKEAVSKEKKGKEART